MTEKPIFREAALERLSTPDRLDQGLVIVNSAGRYALGALVALIVGGAIWALTIRVPIMVAGQGILLTPGGLLEVSSASRGRIVSIKVGTNDEVKAGMTVAEIDQADLRNELAVVEGELRDLTAEREQIVAFQTRKKPMFAAAAAQKRKAYEEHTRFLDTRIAQLMERDKANQELMSKGIIAAQKIIDTQLEIGNAQDQRARNINGLLEMDAEAAKGRVQDEYELIQIDNKIASATRKVESLRERIARDAVVASPYAGRIVELKVNVGEIIERGAPLFTIVPAEGQAGTADANLLAVIYVSPGEGKSVRPGMPVALSPSTAKREEFGFLMGKVRSIAEVPSTPEGMLRTLKNKQLVQSLSNNAAPIEVLVDLERDPATRSGYRWSSSRGPNLKINGGTLASADIEMTSLPLLSLVIPPLRQVAGQAQ